MDIETPQTSLQRWVNISTQNQESILSRKVKSWWKEKEEEMEQERDRSSSIISPLFHYRSGSEGWWRVGQFPQTPSGCPWKWQIARLIALGSWPFRGMSHFIWSKKSIKGVHSQSALSLCRSSEGWPRGRDPKPSQVSTVDTVYDREASPEIKLIFRNLGPWQQHDQASCLTGKMYFVSQTIYPRDQLDFIFFLI